jgi:hypothetical protein
MTVIQKMAKTKKAFSVVASLVRIHLISLLDVYELLRSTMREYSKATVPPLTAVSVGAGFLKQGEIMESMVLSKI